MAPKKAPIAQLSHDVIKTFADGLTASDFERPVQCFECAAEYATPQGLASHLKKHGAVDEDLTELLAVRRDVERRSRANPPQGLTPRATAPLSDLEAATLSPDKGGDTSRVDCKCGRVVSKANLLDHLTKSKYHRAAPLGKDVVRTWYSVKDGWCLSNHKPKEQCTIFETKYATSGAALAAPIPTPKSRPRAQEEDAVSLGAQILANMNRRANAALQASDMEAFNQLFDNACRFAQIRSNTGSSLAGSPTPHPSSKIEVELPAVAIRQEAKDWQHPEGDKAQRVNCPKFLNGGKLYKTFTFDLTEFQKWLPRYTQVKEGGSIRATCGNLERLFHLIEFPNGSDPKGVLCQCLSENIITELKELPVMHKMYSWPKAIMVALDHYLTFLMIKCNRERPRQTETRQTLLELQEEVVQGYKGEDNDQRKVQTADKKRRDTRRLQEQWPSTDLIKAAVKQAMVDLYYCVQIYTGGKDQLALMNKLMIGIIQYNEYAGRTKEWRTLSAAHVAEQFANGKHVLVCRDHKTAQIYGDVGKPLSPGTKKAMQVYDSAFQGDHARKDDLFFQPCQGKEISISYYLRAFGEESFPEIRAPNSNLLRKQFTTVTMRHAKQNKCFEMLRAYDKHGKETMQKHYICESAEEDAEYGSFIFKEVYGEPVPWPADEEFRQMRRKLPFAQEECFDASEDEDRNADEEVGEAIGKASGGRKRAKKLGRSWGRKFNRRQTVDDADRSQTKDS